MRFIRVFGFFVLLFWGISLLMLVGGPAWYHQWMQQLNSWLVGESGYIASDSPALFLHIGLLSGMALPVSLVAFAVLKQELAMLHACLYGALIGVLSLFLLLYGMDKLFLKQFPAPGNNLLFTRLGDFSPGVLYWTSMGTAPRYQLFSGLIELLPATLLLFPRTRFAGLCISLMVLVNVLFINIGFGITVRFLSAFLVAVNIVLLWPYRSFIRAVFRLDTSVIDRSQFPVSPVNRLGMAVFGLWMAWLAFAAFSQEKTWQNRTFEITGASLPCSGWEAGDLLHVHPEGYIIRQHGTDRFQSYPGIKTGPRRYAIPALGLSLELRPAAIRVFTKSDTCNLLVQEHDRNAFPLLK